MRTASGAGRPRRSSFQASLHGPRSGSTIIDVPVRTEAASVIDVSEISEMLRDQLSLVVGDASRRHVTDEDRGRPSTLGGELTVVSEERLDHAAVENGGRRRAAPRQRRRCDVREVTDADVDAGDTVTRGRDDTVPSMIAGGIREWLRRSARVIEDPVLVGSRSGLAPQQRICLEDLPDRSTSLTGDPSSGCSNERSASRTSSRTRSYAGGSTMPFGSRPLRLTETPPPVTEQ